MLAKLEKEKRVEEPRFFAKSKTQEEMKNEMLCILAAKGTAQDKEAETTNNMFMIAIC